MNAMEKIAQAEMARVRRVWGEGGRDVIRPQTIVGSADFSRAVKSAAKVYGVSERAILGKSRVRLIAQARQWAMHLARDAGLSYPQIGFHMDRDHTTVMHGVRVARERLRRDAEGVTFKSTRKPRRDYADRIIFKSTRNTE